MNNKLIILFFIFLILLVILVTIAIYKSQKKLVSPHLIEEPVSSDNFELDELEKIFSSVFQDEITNFPNISKRKSYSLHISNKIKSKEFITYTGGRVLLFRDDILKNPSLFPNSNLKDFWKDKISLLGDYTEFNSIEELDNLTQNDTILIQTTACSSNFYALYQKVLKLKIDIRLNIVILSPYESTNLQMVEHYDHYIDDFLTTLNTGATIKILHTDGFEYTYTYTIK